MKTFACQGEIIKIAKSMGEGLLVNDCGTAFL